MPFVMDRHVHLTGIWDTISVHLYGKGPLVNDLLEATSQRSVNLHGSTNNAGGDILMLKSEHRSCKLSMAANHFQGENNM